MDRQHLPATLDRRALTSQVPSQRRGTLKKRDLALDRRGPQPYGQHNAVPWSVLEDGPGGSFDTILRSRFSTFWYRRGGKQRMNPRTIES